MSLGPPGWAARIPEIVAENEGLRRHNAALMAENAQLRAKVAALEKMPLLPPAELVDKLRAAEVRAIAYRDEAAGMAVALRVGDEARRLA